MDKKDGHREGDDGQARDPAVPILPFIGIVFSAWLIASLQPLTWLRFVIWMAIGLVIYFSYGGPDINSPIDSAKGEQAVKRS